MWVVPGMFCTKDGALPNDEHSATWYGLSRSFSSSFQIGTVFRDASGNSGSNRKPGTTVPGGTAKDVPLVAGPAVPLMVMLPPWAEATIGRIKTTPAHSRNRSAQIKRFVISSLHLKSPPP